MENIKEVIRNSTNNINLKNFISMYTVLKEINDKGKHSKYKDDLKELIQLIIDYLIFGDKKKAQVYFDNFCELDFMKEFIIASKSKTIDILLQIIKSMSALILTITNKSSLFYIFSNNFINDIITNDKIIESSEDFLSFYINFLKSLSMKIDVTTIKLFFQPEKNSFPLLENAIKLYNHEDSMIRNVVKNIFIRFASLSKEYQPLKEFLMSVPMLKFFCFISCRLTDMTLDLNEFAGYNVLYNFNLDKNKQFEFKYEKLKALHDDIIDEILYVNDVLCINDPQITFALINALLFYYICPLLLGSLYNYKFFFYYGKHQKFMKYVVAPEISLYMLTLFFSNVHNDSLLNILSYFLFKKKINTTLIEKFINVQNNNRIPIKLSNYSYTYKEQSNKEKDLLFYQYIAYNFNPKFICNLIMKSKQTPKFIEIENLQFRYEKFFDNSYEPSEHYDEIYNEINFNFTKDEKFFIRHHHDLISLATGIKSGLSQNEYQHNVLFYINKETNINDNPIRNILFDEIIKYHFEIVNFGVNILIYTLFYYIMTDENNNMNNSLSRKFLYHECGIIPYDLYINKNIINKTIINEEENNINNEKDIQDNDNDDNKINEENIINTSSNIINKEEKDKQNFDNNYENLIFKTEKYEKIYKNNEKIYKKKYLLDNKIINNLIILLSNSYPYCSLQVLLNIYNIHYLLFPLDINKNIISKETILVDEQKIKLLSILLTFIGQIKKIIEKFPALKYISFEYLENTLKLYKDNYAFNTKNLITKYILTPYFICIPSTSIDVEDFPFKTNNNKYYFEIVLSGYIALFELIYGKRNFPLKSSNLEYKVGDKINMANINIHEDKIKIIKVLIKNKNRNEFSEIFLFVNNNSIIFGNEEKEEESEDIFFKIKYIHPLREVEICLENSFPNSLQLYFKKIEYIIKGESDEKRKELKADLEKRRNDIQKIEIDSLINFFDEEEKTYSQILDNDKFNFFMGTKIDE